MLVFGDDETVSMWAAHKLGGQFVTAHSAVGILDRDGSLKGAFVVAYHNAHTAELTLYSEGVVTNGDFREFFEWVFGEAGIHRLEIRTRKTNRAIKRAAPKFGFKFEGVQRDFYAPRQDALLFYMTPALCRWIKNHGKHVFQPEAAQGARPERGRRRSDHPEQQEHQNTGC